MNVVVLLPLGVSLFCFVFVRFDAKFERAVSMICRFLKASCSSFFMASSNAA